MISQYIRNKECPIQKAELISYDATCRLLDAIIWLWRIDARRNVIEHRDLAKFMEVSSSMLDRILADTKFSDENKRRLR